MKWMTSKQLGLSAGLLGIAAMGLLLMGSYTGGDVENGGTVRGTVSLRGRAPSLPAHGVADSEHHAVCGRSVPNEEIVTGSGGKLANVVVWIDGITSGAEPRRRTLTLDQRECRYIPRVQAAIRGSRLNITSSDDTLHNVHGYNGGRTEFNLAMPLKGTRTRRSLRRLGVLSMKCDAGHSWMQGYVHVFEHPYFAVTTRNGRFELGDVPPGTYTVKAWHERLGTQTGQVDVSANGTATWNVRFPAR